MLINPALLIFLVASIILLSIVLVSLVIAYVSTMRRLNLFEQQKDLLYQQTQEEQHDALAAAESRASGIINEATRVSNEADDALKIAVSKLAGDIVEEYKKQAEELNKDSINSYSNISKEMMNFTESNLNELKKIMTQQTMEAQSKAEEKFKTQYSTLEKELGEYKQERLNKIDQNIYEILLNVSKVAFGKAISLEKNDELIIEALDEAKKHI